jgi:Na+/melibiose symporter-like transporter
MTGFTLSGRTIAAYVLPTAPLAALGLPMVVYVQPFYISSLGLDQNAVALVMFLARLMDIIIDPFIGWMSDVTRTRWGRRRPWMTVAVPPFMAGVFLLFVPPQDATINYFAIWVVISYLSYSVAAITHVAWGAELSTVYHERTRVQGWREFAAVAGFLLVLLLPVLLEQFVPGATAYDKQAAMGWFIVIAMPITVAILLWQVPEPALVESQTKHKLDIMAAVKLVISNSALRRILAADLLMGLAPGITGALFVWMVIYYLQLPKLYSTLLFIYFVAGLFFIPAWIKLSYRMTKHRALCLACAYSICAGPLIYLIPQGNFWAAAGILILSGVTYGAGGFLLRSIMADVVDVDTLATGRERSGLFYSLLVMTNKLGYALSSLVIVVLSYLGFKAAPGAVNSPEAIMNFSYVFVGFPVFFLILTILTMWSFPIDKFRQQEIREAISRKREEAAAEIAAMKLD